MLASSTTSLLGWLRATRLAAACCLILAAWGTRCCAADDLVAEAPEDVATWSGDEVLVDDACQLFSIRAGAIALYRAGVQSHELLTVQATGEPLLNTADAEPGWGVGPELNVVVPLGAQLDFEFEWFSIND